MRLTVLGVAAAITTILTSCADPVSVQTSSPTTVSQAESQLRQLRAAIEGDLDGHRAVEVLTYSEYQGSLRDCMAAAGQTYRPAPYVDIDAGWDDMPLPDTFAVFAETATTRVQDSAFGAGDVRRNTLVGQLQAQTANEALPKGYHEQLDVCIPQAPSTLEPGMPERAQDCAAS